MEFTILKFLCINLGLLEALFVNSWCGRGFWKRPMRNYSLRALSLGSVALENATVSLAPLTSVSGIKMEMPSPLHDNPAMGGRDPPSVNMASAQDTLRCAKHHRMGDKGTTGGDDADPGDAILPGKGVKDDVFPFEKRTQKLGASLVAGIISISVAVCGTQQVSSAQMLDSQQGKAIFQKTCIGCHYEGGNVLQPGATLTARDLERNGVATEENIFKITYYGKGRMPGFGEKCTPKGQCTFGPRLSDEDIHFLAEYVKLQADQGWPKLERT